MCIKIFYPDGKLIVFQSIEWKKYKGTLLSGSEVQQSRTATAAIVTQDLQFHLFNIDYRLVEVFSKIKLSINENTGLRFEALLTGEMYVSVNGEKQKIKAGEYRITDVPLFKALFKTNSSCSIFITTYSDDLLKQLGIEILPYAPYRMPNEMVNLIHELLHNFYNDELRDFYFENCVRELLFLHLAQNKNVLPSTLINKDIAAIYKADSFIADNLQEPYTINKLSRLVNTNQLKLKSGFKKIFGMSVFKRLLFRRMEHAKLLLESTDKSIVEIARLTGYDTVAGFIHAFRKEFGLTPREWRMLERDNEESSDEQ